MSTELIVANVVRQIIVKAWTDPDWKEKLKQGGNVLQVLEHNGFAFPKYNGYPLYPDIRVVECILGQISYIVVPPNPTNAAAKENILTDLAVVAARGNTVLGI